MLYQIERGKSVFDSHNGLRLIPEFAALEEDARVGDKWMRYVMLVADYKSPLKQHPITKRKELAILSAGGKIQNRNHETLDLRAREIVEGKNPKVEAALAKYLEIQHDEDRDMLEIINKQIELIKKTIMSSTTKVDGKDVPVETDELKKRNALLMTIPDLVEAKKKLARIADIKDEVFIEETSQEVKPLSLVDRIYQETQQE